MTPWGVSQLQRTLMPGIVFHITASHGGVHIDNDLNHQLPESWRSCATQWGWYEEDCEIHLVLYHFAEQLGRSNKEKDRSREVIRRFFPDLSFPEEITHEPTPH